MDRWLPVDQTDGEASPPSGVEEGLLVVQVILAKVLKGVCALVSGPAVRPPHWPGGSWTDALLGEKHGAGF